MESLKKIADLLLDTALDFTKDYQKKAVDLAKIEATAYYVKGVKLVRRQSLILMWLVFSLVLLGVGMAVVPFAILFYCPWQAATKIICISALGVVYIGGPFAFLYRFFSQKRWMEFSKSNDLIDQVIAKN